MEVSALTHPSSIPGLRGPTALLRLQSDERLISLTRRGQHAAFEVLCARYQSRLLSFCRHMLGSREDAEDVLQEVFAAAFNAVLADQRTINVRPWLYRIARNRSLNHLRRASAIGVDSMDVHFAEHGISTGDKVIRRESFRELIADVHHLPETQRTALLLREIDALSYEQIAHAMETTVPSVKSLLVRARISLADAAEARKLSCDDVRLQLGHVAEGLAKLSPPARRHIRSCQQCASFRKQLKDNNHALALIMPVAPLLLLKKLLLAKLGTTASAGGAHVAGGASATVGASATAGAAASGGSVGVGGIMTAGAGALATKAVAGLAAAAIVTAGAVAADKAVVVHHHPHPHALASASLATASHYYASEPVVVHQALQPVSASNPPAGHRAGLAAKHRAQHANSVKAKIPPIAVVAPATTVDATDPSAAKPASPPPATEVTTQTTELPAAATSIPATPPAAATTTSTTPLPATPPTTTGATTTTPVETPPTEPAGPAPSSEPTTPVGATPPPPPAVVVIPNPNTASNVHAPPAPTDDSVLAHSARRSARAARRAAR
ncbi:MAG TPA: RNA polymerase sigma factor [Solirubrobacteraceae bacterium]|jgi:RNA polymerase sigma factor (sigma-70 family)|nr:RNA polymerase sigma factor [Solirubrobacteraceae bacterium]